MVKNKGDLELLYTSTTAKLLQHLYALKTYQECGILRPISLQLAPTSKCNLNCGYCSVKERDFNEIPLESLKITIDNLCSLGLKAVEITGGGEPTLYPHINELIGYCDKKGLEMGLLTNGTQLHRVKKENLDKFSWIRISLNPDQVRRYDIPEIKGTLSFSYVWRDKGFDQKRVDWLQDMVEKYEPAYIRIVANCLTVEEHDRFERIASKIKGRRLFTQSKLSCVTESPCYIGFVKPYLAEDGYFYYCTALVLLQRKLLPEYRMGHMSEVRRIWDEMKPADKTHCEDGKCFFGEQNDLLALVKKKIPHKNFI